MVWLSQPDWQSWAGQAPRRDLLEKAGGPSGNLGGGGWCRAGGRAWKASVCSPALTLRKKPPSQTPSWEGRGSIQGTHRKQRVIPLGFDVLPGQLTCPSRRMFLSSSRCSAVRSRSDLMPRRWQMAIRYRSSSCREQECSRLRGDRARQAPILETPVKPAGTHPPGLQCQPQPAPETPLQD